MTSTDSERRHALLPALVIFTVASTVVVATEFIVIGLLPVLAVELEVSLAKAGTLAGAFALSAAVAGPAVTLVSTAWSARTVMVWSLVAFAVGNAVSVLFPSYWVMLSVRVLQGAALPVFISVGTAAVSALAPHGNRGRVLALANLGFVFGTVLAVPAGVALTGEGVWWQAFIALALLALVAGGLIVWRFPADEREAPRDTIGEQARLLTRPRFLSHVVLSVVSFMSMFAAYTYLAAWLEDVAGLGQYGVAAGLAWFGAAGLIGNMIAARVADRMPLGATVVSVACAAFAALALAQSSRDSFALVALLGVWGAMHTAAVALCQVRVTLAGGQAPAFAMSMNISSANLGIALGSAFGGLVVAYRGVDAIGWGAVSLLIPLVLSTLWTRRADAENRGIAADGSVRA